MTTIQDVAKKADVSTATVSRAIRGLPGVAPSTREQILRVAEELGYTINPQAFRVATGRKVIGIAMPLSDQWFYSKLGSAAEAELLTTGFDVVRYSVDCMDTQASLLKYLATNKLVDGIVFVTLPLPDQDRQVLKRARIPTVTVETVTDEFDSVSIDNVAAAKLATQHLINLGHRRIGLISGLPDDPFHFAIPQARLAGYEQALRENDVEPNPQLVVPGNFSYEGGAEAMKKLLSIQSPPSAVFSLSDEMAIGALKTIRNFNLRVPEDISVIGFDDNDVAAYVDLTTIRQPVSSLGEQAVSLLLAQLPLPGAKEGKHHQLGAKLIVRTTTGPLKRER